MLMAESMGEAQKQLCENLFATQTKLLMNLQLAKEIL